MKGRRGGGPCAGGRGGDGGCGSCSLESGVNESGSMDMELGW